jgi:hypothetical protein
MRPRTPMWIVGQQLREGILRLLLSRRTEQMSFANMSAHPSLPPVPM